jgi:hypothetical protein
VTGFVCVPVFGYAQTEGDPLPGAEEEAAFLSALPLVEIARSWGLHVGTLAAEGTGRLGYYRPGEAIAVGVENLSTWTHELLHYAARPVMPSRALIGTSRSRDGCRRDRHNAGGLLGVLRVRPPLCRAASRSSSRLKPQRLPPRR